MKKFTSVALIMLCYVGLMAQTPQSVLATQTPAENGLTPVSSATIQQIKASRLSGAARSPQAVVVDYDAYDEQTVTDAGGTYERFRGWYINNNWPDYLGANFNINWLAQYFNVIVDGNFTEYDMAVTPYTLDSIDVLYLHENNSGNPDTIKVSVYAPAGTHGVATAGANDMITNVLLWDTMIISNTTLTPGGNFDVLTVYPDSAAVSSLGASGFAVGLDFYGDTLDRLEVIGGYPDYCGGDCFARHSVVPFNTHFRLIVWQQTTTLSGVINGDGNIVYDCNANDPLGTEASCEFFPFQDAEIFPYLTIDPPLQLNAQTANSVVCPDDIITLKANVAGGSGNYNIAWTGPGIFTSPSTDQTDLVVPDTNGTITFSVTAIDLGDPDTVSGTVSVNVRGVNVDLGNDTSIACGDSINVIARLSGSATGASFLWSTGATGNILQNAGAGTYSVTVTNSSGCMSSDAITISIPVSQSINYTMGTVIPPDTVTIGSNTTCQNRKTIFTNTSATVSGWNWEWDYGRPDQIISLNPSPFTTYPNSGTFTLTITADSSGCTVNKTATITVLPESNAACQGVGIAEAEWLRDFVSIYPNPNSGVFDIDLTSLSTSKEVTVSVYDALGRQIFEQKDVDTKSIISVNMNNMNSGFYFARVQVGNDFVTTKISVSK